MVAEQSGALVDLNRLREWMDARELVERGDVSGNSMIYRKLEDKVSSFSNFLAALSNGDVVIKPLEDLWQIPFLTVGGVPVINQLQPT